MRKKSHDKSLANQKPRGRIRRRVMTRGSQPAHRSGRLPATPPYRVCGMKRPLPYSGNSITEMFKNVKRFLQFLCGNGILFSYYLIKGLLRPFRRTGCGNTGIRLSLPNTSGLSSPDKGSRTTGLTCTAQIPRIFRKVAAFTVRKRSFK